MKRVYCLFFTLLPFFAGAHQYDIFEENGKVGLRNEEGKVIIPARYEALGWSNNTFSVVDKVTGYKQKGQWGLITLDNRAVTKPDYDELQPAEGSLLLARKKNNASLRVNAGCITTSGKVAIPFLYDGIKLSALRAIVYTRSANQYKYGMVDLSNKVIIPLSYRNVYPLGSLRFAVENTDHKIAIFSDAGKQLSEFSIDSLSVFRKDYAIIYQNKKQGLIDRNGQVKAPATYRELRIEDDGSIQGRQSDEWIVLDGESHTLKIIPVDSIMPLGKDRFKVTNTGSVRFTDHELNPVGDGPFHAIGPFKEGKAIVRVNQRYGLIRRNGTLVIKPLYDGLRWNASFAIAAQRPEGKTKWMLLDSLGQPKTTHYYDRIADYNGAFFPALNRGRWGALNTQGKEFINCVYDSLLEQKDGHVVVNFRGQHGIISLAEAWEVTPKNNSLELLDSTHYIEHSPRTWFLKTYDGAIIYFSDNPYEVQGKYIIEQLSSGARWRIDLSGRIVDRQFSPEEPVQRIFNEQEGLRAIQRDGKYGFVDNRGRLRIANRYDDVKSYTDGLAAIKLRGHWGFLNHQDKIVVQPIYDEVVPFKAGFSLVKQKGFFGLIDVTGKQVLPTRYENIEILPNKRLRITEKGLTGLADANGRVMIMPRYQSVDDLDNGYVIISREGTFGLVNLQGISTIPQMYSALIYNRFDNTYLGLKRAVWQVVKL